MLPYQSCTEWGLQNGQVAMPLVSSYLAFPSLPEKRAVSFCCTFLEVAFTGCYPAPCPVVLGLSSPLKESRDRLSYSPSNSNRCLRTKAARSFHIPKSYPRLPVGGSPSSAGPCCIRCICRRAPRRPECYDAGERVYNASSKKD